MKNQKSRGDEEDENSYHENSGEDSFFIELFLNFFFCLYHQIHIMHTIMVRFFESKERLLVFKFWNRMSKFSLHFPDFKCQLLDDHIFLLYNLFYRMEDFILRFSWIVPYCW